MRVPQPPELSSNAGNLEEVVDLGRLFLNSQTDQTKDAEEGAGFWLLILPNAKTLIFIMEKN